ncbi:OB-fold nucleic acid binding domain-containing protein [Candidatus Pacearchaeota archaeon]|nr:OB-fold nucleic acid binding domain-containing protein [Candidatus Pacearchaeota archaeon]
MSAETIKRNTAYKLRIGDVIIGKPTLNGERFSFLELGDKKIIRVNIVGNVIDKFSSEGEKKYSFATIDDGSGQIRIKAFGEDLTLLDNITQGQTILVIGNLRFFSNELYIAPEIIRQLEPQYLLVRKLEIEKEKNKNRVPLDRTKVIAIKDSLLTIIKNSEINEGINADEIIMKPELRGTSPEIINQEIQKMLEEGIIFEPRPGKLRWLG